MAVTLGMTAAHKVPVATLAIDGSTAAVAGVQEEVASLKPENIRQYAADRFPISATAAGYLELYQRVIDGEPLA